MHNHVFDCGAGYAAFVRWPFLLKDQFTSGQGQVLQTPPLTQAIEHFALQIFIDLITYIIK